MTIATARDALAHLLEEYDRANRLEIDALYAQFSPTLDDYYAEELRIAFPAEQHTLSAAGETIRPDLLLTRTVPGQEPRSVHAQGAPFPLARARALVSQALAAGSNGQNQATWRQLAAGTAWLRPVQAGRSQLVRLLVEPQGKDVAALVAAR